MSVGDFGRINDLPPIISEFKLQSVLAKTKPRLYEDTWPRMAVLHFVGKIELNYRFLTLFRFRISKIRPRSGRAPWPRWFDLQLGKVQLQENFSGSVTKRDLQRLVWIIIVEDLSRSLDGSLFSSKNCRSCSSHCLQLSVENMRKIYDFPHSF